MDGVTITNNGERCYDLNQSKDRTPKLESLSHKMVWSTVSKAFCRSSNTMSVYKPSAVLCFIKFNRLIKHVSVENFDLKPD